MADKYFDNSSEVKKRKKKSKKKKESLIDFNSENHESKDFAQTEKNDKKENGFSSAYENVDCEQDIIQCPIKMKKSKKSKEIQNISNVKEESEMANAISENAHENSDIEKTSVSVETDRKKMSLLDDASDSEIELTINKDYANRYDKWRESEELQKYKDLKKDEEDSDSSSESEVDVEQLPEDFFRGFSILISRDSRLYDKNFQLFPEKQLPKKPKAKKQKPMYMKDYERNLILERGGKLSDEDEDDKQKKIITYDEEQESLKKSFKDAGGSDDSDVESLLQVRPKTKKEEEEKDADYIKWLKREKEEIAEDAKKDLSYLRDYWNDQELSEEDKFLRDYLLNYHRLEENTEIPTYEEITSSKLSDDEKTIEEQENFEHKYNFRFEEPDEEFIKRYPRTIGDSLRRVDNKRKEKREEKSERKRKEREQRREELKRLKALKRKEIEEKFMKIKETSGQDKIDLNESDIESDFDPDKHDQRMNELFDNEYYQVEEEQKPEFPYDEELDSENWNTWCGQKIIEEGEEDENLSDNDEGNTNKNESTSNPKDEFANEMINASRPKKKVKKKSLFAKIISQSKPVYDPDGKSFAEYVDEYYNLDYEDYVGGMPVRYKYRKVIPNDFGLTVEEILAADDRELNRWCSVKKTCQYRNEEEELYDVQAFRKKAQIPHIKQKCLPSVYAPKTDETAANSSNSKNSKRNKIDYLKNTNSINSSESKEVESESKVQFSEAETVSQTTDQNFSNVSQVKKRKKKSKKKEEKLSESVSENDNNDEMETSLMSSLSDNADFDQDEPPQNTKKSKKIKEKQNISGIDEEREMANVILENTCETSVSLETNRKSKKRKRKHSDGVSENSSPKSKQNQSDSSETNSSLDIAPEASISENTSDVPPKKKKKKNKHKENNSVNVQQSMSNHFYNTSNKYKSKDKQKKWASEDKRLNLSDDRLAAYGINPKKFKNRIIYSKK